MGRPVLHPDPRAPGRRSDPDREHFAAVRHADDSAVRRQPARTQPRRLLQPVQPGQAQHPAGPAKARSGQARLPTGQALRCRGRQFRGRRDQQARLQLREALRDQTRHHPDLDVRLRAVRPVPPLCRLRTAGVRALGAILADRLPGRRPLGNRRLVSRPQRRRDGRLRDHRRPAPSRPDRRGPVHRPVAVGGRAGAHGRGPAGVGHQPSRAQAQRQSRPPDGAARDLQEHRQRRPVGFDRGRHRG